LGGALESFGDVADFLVEAEGGGAFGVGGEDEDGGLGHGRSWREVAMFIYSICFWGGMNPFIVFAKTFVYNKSYLGRS
jgi:hypothetical protein